MYLPICSLDCLKKIFAGRQSQEKKTSELKVQFDISLFLQLPPEIQKIIISFMQKNDKTICFENLYRRLEFQKKFSLTDDGSVQLQRWLLSWPEVVLYAENVVQFNVCKQHIVGLEYVIEQRYENPRSAQFLIAQKGASNPIDCIELLPKREKPYGMRDLFNVGQCAISDDAQKLFYLMRKGKNSKDAIVGVLKVKENNSWIAKEEIDLSAYGELNDFKNVGFFDSPQGIGLLTAHKEVFVPLKPEGFVKKLKDSESATVNDYFFQKGGAKNLNNSLSLLK